MSRLGKIPVDLPKDAKVAFDQGSLLVNGPKGKVALKVPRGITVEQKDNKIMVLRGGNSKQDRANHGTVRANLVNMLKGVTQGHKIDLEIQGVGFRGAVTGQKLTLNLGFSHQVDFEVPAGVKVAMPKPTEISLESSDNAVLGNVAAKIRAIKPPEPYKGKGIRYAGEKVRRKQGKAVTK